MLNKNLSHIECVRGLEARVNGTIELSNDDMRSLMILYEALKVPALSNIKYKAIVDVAFSIRIRRTTLRISLPIILDAIASMTSREYSKMIDRL